MPTNPEIAQILTTAQQLISTANVSKTTLDNAAATISQAIDSHEAEANPHTGYLRNNNGDIVNASNVVVGKAYIYVGNWEGRPPALGNADKMILVNNSVFVSDGTFWRYVQPIKLMSNGNPGSSTTGTNETVLATIPVKASMLANNGTFLLNFLVSYNNSANIKTIRLRIGGTGLNGTILFNQDFTTTSKNLGRVGFKNRNVQNSQIQYGIEFIGSGLGATAANILTSTVDTSQDFNVYLTGQCANSGEVITLQMLEAELS